MTIKQLTKRIEEYHAEIEEFMKDEEGRDYDLSLGELYGLEFVLTTLRNSV